jgi:hypothetical protein
MKPQYQIGYSSTYIQDHPNFKFMCEIPESVAVEWVKNVCPGKYMGSSKKACQLTVSSGNIDTDAKDNGWLNKLFVIVSYKVASNNEIKWIALVKWDSRFSIYTEMP